MTVARYWRKQVHRYNLVGTHCNECGEYFYPPRNMCPTCRRDGKIEPHKFNGAGEVVTYTVIRSAAEGFGHQTPFVLAVVKLDEGSQHTSQIVCKPEETYIGMRVKPVFRRIGQSDDRDIIHYGTKFVPA